MRILLIVLLTAGTAFAQAGVPQGPTQGPPPKNLTKQADGHISANATPANTADFDVHTVVAGETLSGIAAASMKDMKLWPQLWEQNEHIVNPHWIYPNDKILIRRVTKITEATPPGAAQPGAAEQPIAADANANATAVARPPTRLYVAPYPTPPAATPPAVMNFADQKNFSEVKDSDLYCSGFIRPAITDGAKVSTLAASDTAILAAEGNYLYINKGTKDGVRGGTTYQIVRPTRAVDSPSRPVNQQKLGTHYIEVGQIQIVMGQDSTAMARVTQTCDAVEVGDLVIPYTKTPFPALPAKRPFSATMKASGQMPAKVVMTKGPVQNFSSMFPSTARLAGVGGTSELGTLSRGIAGEGHIVYLDLGKSSGAKPGDLFIVFRDMAVSDTRVAVGDVKAEKRKIAIAEIVILRVEDRASTALVTYTDDGVALGDSVERR
jgi:LysM repeat protein